MPLILVLILNMRDRQQVLRFSFYSALQFQSCQESCFLYTLELYSQSLQLHNNLLLILLVLYERFAFGNSNSLTDFIPTAIFVLMKMIYFIGSLLKYQKKKKRNKAKSIFVKGMMLKRADKACSNVNDKKEVLSSTLIKSIIKLKKKMNSLTSSYKSDPHPILLLMYMLINLSLKDRN